MKRRRKRRNRFSCLDCGVNTDVIGEYYMVHDEVWTAAFGGKQDCPGMLCVGCLETRIHRRLMPWDFMAVSVNFHRVNSPRLYSRLLGKNWHRSRLARWALDHIAADDARKCHDQAN